MCTQGSWSTCYKNNTYRSWLWNKNKNYLNSIGDKTSCPIVPSTWGRLIPEITGKREVILKEARELSVSAAVATNHVVLECCEGEPALGRLQGEYISMFTFQYQNGNMLMKWNLNTQYRILQCHTKGMVLKDTQLWQPVLKLLGLGME